jgi:hypothetical protein
MNGSMPGEPTAPDQVGDATPRATDERGGAMELPDRRGDVTVALTPRDLAFMALIAAVILAILRRVIRGARSRGGD